MNYSLGETLSFEDMQCRLYGLWEMCRSGGSGVGYWDRGKPLMSSINDYLPGARHSSELYMYVSNHDVRYGLIEVASRPLFAYVLHKSNVAPAQCIVKDCWEQRSHINHVLVKRHPI